MQRLERDFIAGDLTRLRISRRFHLHTKTFDAALCMNLLEPFFSVLVPLICLGLDRLDRDRKRKIYTTGFSCKGYKAQS